MSQLQSGLPTEFGAFFPVRMLANPLVAERACIRCPIGLVARPVGGDSISLHRFRPAMHRAVLEANGEVTGV
jgi:hypothetical protein